LEIGDLVNELQLSSAQQIALWADKLRDMSAMGLHFSKDIYDQQRYREMQTMAMEMHALATGDSLESLEPLRDTIYARPCPFCTGDAAIIDNAGRLLLIQRADRGTWAMPGGVLEVGETAAQGIVREALEEAGVRCAPERLVGIFDSRYHQSQSRYHLFQFVFLCRPAGEPEEREPSHAHETLGKGWFAENALPTNLDPNHVTRIPHVFRVWRGGEPFFDH
jgi:ADP-ribose pyrophosphatase YjhB (NUDIX family)